MQALDPSSTSLVLGTLAYLDPGTGAMILQVLVAGVAGIVLFLKLQGRRVLSLLGLRRKGQEPGSPGDD